MPRRTRVSGGVSDKGLLLDAHMCIAHSKKTHGYGNFGENLFLVMSAWHRLVSRLSAHPQDVSFWFFVP